MFRDAASADTALCPEASLSFVSAIILQGGPGVLVGLLATLPTGGVIRAVITSRLFFTDERARIGLRAQSWSAAP